MNDSRNLGTSQGLSSGSSGLENDLTEVRLHLDAEHREMRNVLGIIGGLRTNDKRHSNEASSNNLNEHGHGHHHHHHHHDLSSSSGSNGSSSGPSGD